MYIFMLQTSLLLGAVSCAPPIEPDPAPTETPILEADSTTIVPVGTVAALDKDDAVEQDENVIGNLTSEITEAATEETITVGFTTSPPPQQTTPQLSGKERKALISHLSEYDLSNVDPLVLTPRQQFAILQELEHQKLGLSPFADPTPWQRLTREQQLEFNRRYLALREDLQEYSRNQFLSLPEDRQAHAYNAFLSVDFQTLSNAIEQEFVREREVLQQERFTQQQRLSEQQRFFEQQRIDKQQRLVEQQRLSEQQRLAKQQMLVEQQRLAEQQKIIEQNKIATQQRLTVQEKSDELEAKRQQEIKAIEREFVREPEVLKQERFSQQQRPSEKQSLTEQQRLAEQQKRLVEQQRITEQHKFSAQLRLTKEKKDAELEDKRQQEINKLFEIAQSQPEERVIVQEQTRTGSGNILNSLEQLKEIPDEQFQHFKPVQQNVKSLGNDQQPSVSSTQLRLQAEQRNPLKPRKLSFLPTKQSSQFSQQPVRSSLREQQRQQKRLNIRRLNFDPRRRQ